MSAIIDKLIAAQNYAMSTCPKVGAFPMLAEILRQAGVIQNRWVLPSCQSTYIFKDAAIVQQADPLINGLYEIPHFNQDELVKALRVDQAGQSTFSEFLQAAWEAGVVAYDVDFIEKQVIYYGINGESYLEKYPYVEVKNHAHKDSGAVNQDNN